MLASFLLILPLVLAQNISYTLQDSFKGIDFYHQWDWLTIDDPTRGRTNYVDKETAIAKNLTYLTESGALVMRVDSTSIVSPTSRGRDSIRITTQAAYDEALIIANISHMPIGCGTWPAFWMFSEQGPWPAGGEIDILEAVHDNTTLNIAALHTSPNCLMDPKDSTGKQTGRFLSTNCDANFNWNQGCGVELKDSNSVGKGFNSIQGGYYVTEKTRHFIRVWFFRRGDSWIEKLAADAPSSITTDDFPIPDAYFPLKENCDPDHFDAHNLVINIALCGDWAGNTFTQAGCGKNCTVFVDNNPEAFTNAYWVIDSLSVYTKDVASSSIRIEL
ncbi:glycoside hydrolase family 16 protein [Marasmius fiardii PR-910]|nr:glycoside hydrolase family 16 protein [Marasmius fiardii PR-910]